MNDTRYQFQPWYVKRLRWLRYRPPSLLKFVWWVVTWIARACPCVDWGNGLVETRQQTLETLWGVCKSEAQYKMQWYWSTEEFLADLRAS